MQVANEYIQKRLILAKLQEDIKELESQLLNEMEHGSYTTPQGTVSLVFRTVTKVDPSVSEKKKSIREKIEPEILKLEESIKPAIEQLEKEAKEQGLIVEEQVKNLRFTKAK